MVCANHVIDEEDVPSEGAYQQLDLFTDYEKNGGGAPKGGRGLQRERKVQEAMLAIRKKFWKNAVLRGTGLELFLLKWGYPGIQKKSLIFNAHVELSLIHI